MKKVPDKVQVIEKKVKKNEIYILGEDKDE
jgi:hypothetical protein